MDARVGLAFLFVLLTSCVGEARNSFTAGRSTYGLSAMQLHYPKPEAEIQVLEKADRIGSVCSVCEDFATEVIDWLKENSTETEIETILLDICSILPSPYNTECTTSVNTYAPVVVLELAVIQAVTVCQAIKLCDTTIAQQDRCEKCQNTIAEVVQKLNDPDAQMEILQKLMKACNSVEGHVKECKKMVVLYGPLILDNAEKYLENKDICTAMHACASPKVESKQASSSLSKMASSTDS